MRSFTTKFLSVFLSILTIITVAFGTNAFAYAADATTSTKVTLDYKKVVEVANYNLATNIGGMAAGTANNRLFVVKSCNDNKTNDGKNYEKLGTLYYYSNIYNPSNVKRIKFTNALLGHANAMAVDDDYIYVTMWQEQAGGEKTRILQINRKAISALPDGYTVTSASQVYNGIKICTRFYPKNPDGTKYTAASITSIAKYSYDATNKKTTFIISAGNYDNRNVLIYKKAILDHNTNVITVQNENYFIKNPTTLTIRGTAKSVTIQDIFYDKEYGLFINIWHGKDNNYGGETFKRNNSVLQVDLNRATVPYTIQTGSYAGSVINVINPTYINLINSKDESLDLFELESMVFIKKTSDKQSSTLRALFTANMHYKEGSGCDSIIEIKNPSTTMRKL